MTWVQIGFRAEEAALLHSMLRESGWGYSEAGVPEVANAILELAGIVRQARERSGTIETVAAQHAQLFDAQFDGVSDRTVILGVDE